MHLAPDVIQVFPRLLRLTQRFRHPIDTRVMLLLHVGKHLVQRWKAERKRFADGRLRAGDDVVVEHFRVVAHHVLRHKVKIPEIPPVGDHGIRSRSRRDGNRHFCKLLPRLFIQRLDEPVAEDQPAESVIIACFDHHVKRGVIRDIEVHSRHRDGNGGVRIGNDLYPVFHRINA